MPPHVLANYNQIVNNPTQISLWAHIYLHHEFLNEFSV